MNQRRDGTKLINYCIKKGYFTCGDSKQYNKVIDAYAVGGNLESIADMIWICSDNAGSYEERKAIVEELAKLEGGC